MTVLRGETNTSMRTSSFIAKTAIIAAMYATITILLAPLSYGQIQLRVSEILTVLPYFTPAAVPGLFIGCLLANLYSPNGILDIAVGSLATLVAAYLSSKMKKKWLVPLPPILVNGVFIGLMLHYMYQLPVLITMLYIAIGQAVVCYGLGMPLLYLLDKINFQKFLDS